MDGDRLGAGGAAAGAYLQPVVPGGQAQLRGAGGRDRGSLPRAVTGAAAFALGAQADRRGARKGHAHGDRAGSGGGLDGGDAHGGRLRRAAGGRAARDGWAGGAAVGGPLTRPVGGGGPRGAPRAGGGGGGGAAGAA